MIFKNTSAAITKLLILATLKAFTPSLLYVSVKQASGHPLNRLFYTNLVIRMTPPKGKTPGSEEPPSFAKEGRGLDTFFSGLFRKRGSARRRWCFSPGGVMRHADNQVF
jgi:hypothetical protein